MLIASAYGAPALQHRWFFTHPKQQAIFKSCEGRKLQEMIPGNKRRPPVRNPFLKNELPKCSTAESLRKKKRAPKRVLLFKLNERHSNHPLCWSEWRHRKECHIWSYCWPQKLSKLKLLVVKQPIKSHKEVEVVNDGLASLQLTEIT